METAERTTVDTATLREVVKWAYRAAVYDGQVPISQLEALDPAVAEIIGELKQRDSWADPLDLDTF